MSLYNPSATCLTVKSKLVILLFFKAVVSLILIHANYIALSPDEAQYWTWSQELDWGYYSKPPAIAWQIFLTTKLLGNTELGVRLGAVILSFLLPLIAYHLARAVHLSEKGSFYTALLLAFSPLGMALSFGATTDGGMMVCFMMATLSIVLAFEKRQSVLWTGMWVGLGALYKWTTFLFWPFALLFYPRKKIVLVAIALSLLALLPSLYWNATHDFVTFRHIAATVVPTSKKGGNFLDFIGAQIALLSPITFALLALGIIKNPRPGTLRFCALFPLGALIYLALSLTTKMQPNWAAYLYPPGVVIAGWYASEHCKRGGLWVSLAVALSLLLTSFALAVPALQSRSIFRIPYKLNPLRQSLGWNHLEQTLTTAGYNSTTDFLFADKYQMASLLSFYGPHQKRAYFFNLGNARRNQFSYWPSMTQEKGRTGYFVLSENTDERALPWYRAHYLSTLAPYFTSVTWQGAYPLFHANGVGVKWVMILRCTDYNGSLPHNKSHY